MVYPLLIKFYFKNHSQELLHRDGFSENARFVHIGALDERRMIGEPLQGQRYRVGEEYRHHRDHFRIDKPHWQVERRRGGQRTWTAMVYLNAVEEGGETDFPELDLKIAPEPGLLVLWDNMDRQGMPNPASGRMEHAAARLTRPPGEVSAGALDPKPAAAENGRSSHTEKSHHRRCRNIGTACCSTGRTRTGRGTGGRAARRRRTGR